MNEAHRDSILTMPILTEEQPILAELRKLGFDVEHIQDLYQQHVDYKRAIPLLVSWIPRVEDTTVEEMLVRAVTDPAARGIAGPTLVHAPSPQLPLDWWQEPRADMVSV
jgi:hypothetical protein